MSLNFSSTADLNGIIQLIEAELGFDYGQISGNETLLKEITALVNLTLDDYIALAIKSSGKWQFDDSNHSNNYNVIYTNLVSGQRDYPILVDEDDNLVLDIYKVMILPSTTATLYQEIYPIDELDGETDIAIESTSSGIPYAYGKMANGIFVEPNVNFSKAKGLKVFVNREGSYFSTADTTKKPGVPGLHHEYFVLKPSMRYARRKSLAAFPRLQEAVIEYEGNEAARLTGKIQEYFTQREKDVVDVINNEPIMYE